MSSLGVSSKLRLGAGRRISFPRLVPLCESCHAHCERKSREFFEAYLERELATDDGEKTDQHNRV